MKCQRCGKKRKDLLSFRQWHFICANCYNELYNQEQEKKQEVQNVRL